MKKIIRHIREQSEKTRRHILYVFTVIAIIVLFSLWIYSLGISLSDPITQRKVNNDLKPFSALKGDLMDGYQNITE